MSLFYRCLILSATISAFAAAERLHAQEACSDCDQCTATNARGVEGWDILFLDGCCCTGICSQAIPCQPPDLASAALLDKLVHKKDIRGLLELIRTGKAGVEFVPSRNAIAIHGCGDKLIGLFMLPQELRWTAMLAARNPARERRAPRPGSSSMFDLTSSSVSTLASGS